MQKYDPKKIEPKWQKIWEEQQTYKADLESKKPKYIAMSMFNYPSGAGIHIGHAMNYTISDVMARFKRQQGYESYHPVGWDAFGLPAENHAIKSGVSPQESMQQIIPWYHKQYRGLGWSNDWSKEISTHDPTYYKWSQWIFSEMYRQGLAYRDSRMQWWCEIDNTVLADEQVTAEGKCWRHDDPGDPIVKKREIKQWFFKITDYAEELLEAIDDLDWTEGVKEMQRHWIGKSEGALVKFPIVDSEKVVEVFTTRIDTIFSGTFVVIAPEHPLVEELTVPAQKAKVKAYLRKIVAKSEQDRLAAKTKDGIFTGSYAINPASQDKVPIWIADFVLGSYGTGAIFGDGHDERDQEFAQTHGIPLKLSLEPVTGQPQSNPEYRRSIVALVRHPKTGKLLSINWGSKLGGHLLIGGGLEEGEDPLTTAKREIKEETGYKHLKHLETSETIHHHYFAHSKGKARQIDVTAFCFELEDEAQDPIQLEEDEKAKFSVEWLDPEVAAIKIQDELHHYVLDKFIFGKPFTGEGILFNSGQFNGLASAAARPEIIKWLESKNLAEVKTQYRLQDWSVSRQRYWGAPIPIIHCSKCGPVLVPDKELPVVLPELSDFQPTGDGRSALARAEGWVRVKCPQCGGSAERETDTLDTYIDSGWYMLRYFDPHNPQQIFDSKVVNKWLPIDFYNGADHATAHMIYARFITRFFYKQGLISHPEPFKRFLFNGKVVDSQGKMFSKSKGNAPDPLEITESGYGADALRTYLMFAAPLEQWVRWEPQGLAGTYRWLSRVWNLNQEFLATKEDDRTSESILKLVHPAIAKVTADIEQQRYNTAIASLMELTNQLHQAKTKHQFSGGRSWRWGLESLVQLLAPFAPHISEELWQQLGHQDSIHIDHWPQLEERYLNQERVTVVVQINGKLRASLSTEPGLADDQLTKLAHAEPKIKQQLAGREITKTIVVADKLVNFVAR